MRTRLRAGRSAGRPDLGRPVSNRWCWAGPVALLFVVLGFSPPAMAATERAGAMPVRFEPPTLLEAGAIAGLAISPKGTAIVVWHRDRIVRVASRRADGQWERPVTLDRGSGCRKDFRTAINARGDAVIAWTQNRGCYEGSTPTLLAATRTERRWSQPTALGRTWGPASVGLTARGIAVLGWRTGRTIWTITGDGTRWDPPHPLRQAPAGVGPLALRLHANGRGVAMWAETVFDAVTQRNGARLMTSSRARAGGWTVAEPIPGAGPWSGTSMNVAITGDGEILGAWADAPTGVVQVVEYRPADGWSPPRALGTTDSGNPRLSLDMNDRGEAVVGWSRFRPIPVIQTEDGELYGHTEAFAAARSIHGAWSPPERLSTARPEVSAGTVEVGIAGDGEIFATWPVGESLGDDRGMKAAIGTASSGWHERLTITHRGNGRIAFEPQFAVADGPRAMIGWNQLAGRTGPRRPTVAVSVTR